MDTQNEMIPLVCFRQVVQSGIPTTADKICSGKPPCSFKGTLMKFTHFLWNIKSLI